MGRSAGKCLVIATLAAAMNAFTAGVYTVRGHDVYAAVVAEPPDRPQVQFFDPATRRFDTLPMGSTIGPRRVTVYARRFTVANANGRLGASLWYRDDAKRPTVVLIQGADDSTRDMGALIPYFVANGANVASYDQRGTGVSTGNWRYASPVQKAEDIESIIDRLRFDPHVDAKKVGVWGPSSGGWVAPIVATHARPAFMILKSAPSESIASNILYEVRAVLAEKRVAPSQIERAMAFERGVFSALADRSPWNPRALADASAQPWFAYMRIPPGFTEPPPQSVQSVMRNAYLYDPTSALQHVRTPTLALFGSLDRNVDAPDSIARLRTDFETGGYRNLTIRTFARADHILEESTTGYLDDPVMPQRFVSGYPETMISWLVTQGILPRTSTTPK